MIRSKILPGGLVLNESAGDALTHQMTEEFDLMFSDRVSTPQDLPSCLKPYEAIQYAMKDIPAEYQQVYLEERDDLAGATAYFE